MNLRTREELGRRLAEAEEIEFAYLFGSRSNGTAREDSDWDIAVYFNDALTAGERFENRLALISELEESGDVDVVVLNEAPPLLGHRALMGVPLVVRNKTIFVRYFVKTLAESEDERYFRRVHIDARQKRLEEGRFGRP